MDSKSLSTVNSHTNAHTVRGIATLRKEVECFRKGHFERYRESIVKLIVTIVKYLKNLSNKLSIYPKETFISAYTNSRNTTNSTPGCEQSSNEGNTRSTSISSEEDARLRPTAHVYTRRPCDTQSNSSFS